MHACMLEGTIGQVYVCKEGFMYFKIRHIPQVDWCAWLIVSGVELNVCATYGIGCVCFVRKIITT